MVVLLNFAAPDGQAGQTKLHHALAAFQKTDGQAAAGELTGAEFQKIREKIEAAGDPAPRETGYARVEVNLNRQILTVVDASGHVLKTLPISSGSGKWFTSEGRSRRAITPRGRFAVYHKIAGWRKSPLGLLYYPNYITEGIAIHGSPSVPPRPASHGCIRIPMSAAKWFSDVTPIGTPVMVY